MKQHLGSTVTVCKLPLGMQRPIVNNEISKESCATSKGRKSDVMWILAYIQYSYIVNCISAYSNIAILNSLTEVI